MVGLFFVALLRFVYVFPSFYDCLLGLQVRVHFVEVVLQVLAHQPTVVNYLVVVFAVAAEKLSVPCQALLSFALHSRLLGLLFLLYDLEPLGALVLSGGILAGLRDLFLLVRLQLTNHLGEGRAPGLFIRQLRL